MERWDGPEARLALLVDADRATAYAIRPLLLAQGLELVHARAGVAALELLQRLPERFALALVTIDLPDLSGAVVIETLRLFRPELALVCLVEEERAPSDLDTTACLSKPIQQSQFNSQLAETLAGSGTRLLLATEDVEVVARAEERYQVSGSLIEAARELARGFPASPEDL